MKAKILLDELNSLLKEKKTEKRVIFTKPINKDEIIKAEKELGVRLPSSYVDFVVKNGLFCIDGGLTKRGSGNDTKLFSPIEIIKETKKYRKEMKDYEDIESQEILNDGLIFCGDPIDEYFHLFVISSAKKYENAEMHTREYDYQDPANNDPWYEGESGGFDLVVKNIVNNVKKEI